MFDHIIVAIDGPAASGKSTTARLAAQKMGFLHLDTGAMYRSVALLALENGIDVFDTEKINEIASTISIEFEPHENGQRVKCNGKDVTLAIRSQEVTGNVSAVSAIAEVREKMVALQREIAQNKNAIIEGRDIGTVVFPDATLKFWVIASTEIRAQRRAKEIKNTNIELLKVKLEERDEKDSAREHSPLIKADDAIELDTTNFTIEEQVDFVCQKILKKQNGGKTKVNEKTIEPVEVVEETKPATETEKTEAPEKVILTDESVQTEEKEESVDMKLEESPVENTDEILEESTEETADVPAADEETIEEIDEESVVEAEAEVEIQSEEAENFEIPEIPIEELEERKDVTPLGFELEELVEQSFRNVNPGQCVMGTVVAVTDRDVSIDIGGKSEGIIDIDEFNEDEHPAPGDEIEIFLKELEDRRGKPVLSKREANYFHAWKYLIKVADEEEIIEGLIQRRIKGGFEVEIKNISCFLPGSQIDIRPVTDFDDFLGETMDFKIVKIDQSRKNIVLSHKVLLEEELKGKRDELIEQIKIGMVLEGHVKNVTDFGVFVDLGGIDGLLHITDMSWGRVGHPRELVKIDDIIQVKVIDFDPERARVSLGMKQLTEHPWENIGNRYKEGETIKGKVVSLTNYGAFIELESGVEGLVHISELSWTQHIKHPNEVLNLGDEVKAVVLGVDSEARKISLGIKQLTQDPWDKVVEKYAVETIHPATVRGITQYGLFCELEEDIEGLVHVSDISWTKKIRHPREFAKKGDEIEVKILSLSPEQRKISLGIKQIEDNPWPELDKKFGTGTSVDGTVVKVLDKSLIVELPGEINGIVPLMGKQRKRKSLQEFTEGMQISLTVVEFNAEKQLIKLQNADLVDTKQDKEKVEEEIAMAKLNEDLSPETLDIPENIMKAIQDAEVEEGADKNQEISATEETKEK